MDASKVPPAAHFTVSLPVASIPVVPSDGSAEWETAVWMSTTALAAIAGVNMHKQTAEFIELYQTVEATLRSQFTKRNFVASAAAEAVAILMEDGEVSLTAANDSPEEQALASRQLAEIVSCLGGTFYMTMAILKVADQKGLDFTNVGNRVVDFRVQLSD